MSRRALLWFALLPLATAGCPSDPPTASEPEAAAQTTAADASKSAPDGASEPASDAPADTAEVSAVAERARAIFSALPDEASSEDDPVTDEKVVLGRMLYYEPRLSKSHTISCNSCHDLAGFGIDGTPVSTGHRQQKGERNAPTVINAALHVAQFWDGRAEDVEEQAKGPILNPIEMGMPDQSYVLTVLGSIPDYEPLFRAAFPDDEEPITYDNMARAIGAFERRILSSDRFDAFLEGDTTALTGEEIAGLETFMDTGCVTCHNQSTIGGQMFQKLGAVEPYPTEDTGRMAVTGEESDRYVFKVPSLRNVAETGPYLHDGSIESLDEMIRIMGRHQLGKQLDDEQVAEIHAFLESLTGTVDPDLVAEPELPESGPDTPAPDPS